MNPRNVTARGITVHRIIRDTGPGGFCMAEISQGRERSHGIRWNGEEGANGYPTSRGYPVWFDLPREMAEVLLGHYQANETPEH